MKDQMQIKDVKSYIDNLNVPTLAPLPKRGWWVNVEDWNKYGHTVPSGFTTDLDSVPKVPYLYAAIKGHSVWAALLHDYLYASRKVTRKEADVFFRRGLLEEGVPGWIASAMYYAVRGFGWMYYKKIAKKGSSDGKTEVGVKGRLLDNHRAALQKR